MEMWQVMLGYPQVHTDMVFENVTTLPLEQRAGVECKSHSDFMEDLCEDGSEMLSISYQIRAEKRFPIWRQHRDEELLILQGLFKSSISVDKITKFSVRPPELRDLVKNVGNYYRWFYVKNERMNRDHVETALELSLDSCMWVDGLQNQVYLRTKAIPEMKEYLNYLDVSNDIFEASNEMKDFMQNLIQLNYIYCGNMEFCCEEC